MGYLSPSLVCFVALDGVALLVSVLSNGLVILSVIRFRQLRSVTNIFIVNLAVSDILLAGTVIPQKLHDMSHTENFHEGQFLCKLVNFSPVLCIMSSVYSLVVISAERYRAVVRHSYTPAISSKTCFVIIGCIWLAAWLVSVPTILEFSEHIIHETVNETSISCGSGLVPHGFSIFNGIFLALVSYVIPLVVISTNYTKIALFLSRQGTTTNVARGTTVSKNRMKIVKMMIIVTVLFAVAWLPYFVVLIISKVTGENGSEDSAGPLALLMISLSTFSTLYNAILYVIYNNNFRRAFKMILFCGKVATVAPEAQTTFRPPTVVEMN